MPKKGEFVQSGNSSVPIEAYGVVKLKVDTPEGKKHITLENVSLVRGFMSNIVSMPLLNTHGFHWSSREPTNLEFEDHYLACMMYQVGGHILFNSPGEPTPNTSLMVRLNYDPRLRTLTESNLH